MSTRFSTVVMWSILRACGHASVGAQQFTGGVRGAVRDANGVIPGVAVTLTNEATNIARDTVTNEVGQYNFPAVTPGTYTLKTQLTGYKSHESKGLVVATQQFITLDVVLEVGALEESITVTGQSPLIDTSTASTGGVLDREALESLPAPGRNAFLIGITVPTVMTAGDPQFNRQQDQSNASIVSLGGGGMRANNYLLDGVPITELVGRAVLNPTIEAVEEVKVQVHTYDAEMGRTGGGVFNVTAKSGTNNYHGSGFYQTRPVWGVNENFFVEKQGVSKEESGLADTYYRLYGGGFGGPIWKNRTFFWAATEGYRSNTTQERAAGLAEPEAAHRRLLDLDGRRSAGPDLQPVLPRRRRERQMPGDRDWITCDRRPVHRRASSRGPTRPRTRPASASSARGRPRPSPARSPRNENGLPNAIATGPIVDAADMFTIKAEHKFTDQWSLSGLYIYNKTDEPGSTIMKPDAWYIASQDNFFGPLRRRPHVLVFNNTNIINDTTVLTLRYGWTHVAGRVRQAAVQPGIGSLGFSPNYTNALSQKDVFPDRAVRRRDAGRRRLGRHPQPVEEPVLDQRLALQADGQPQPEDRRRHAAHGRGDRVRHADGRAVRLQPPLHEQQRRRRPRTGQRPARRARTPGRCRSTMGRSSGSRKYYGAYVQDDWRVSERLTLNYGLRLEHEDGLREIENRQTVAFDQNATNPLDARVPKTGLLAGRTLKGGLIFAGVDGAPEAQGNPAAIKVAPRVGATYAPQQEHGPPRRLRPLLRAVELHQGAARTGRLHADDRDDSVRRARPRVPIVVAGQSVPGRLDPADWQLAGPAHRHRRHDQLHRSGQGRPEGPPVLVRRAARAAGRHGGHHRLHRRHRPRHRLLRHRAAATPARRSTSTRSIRRSRARRSPGRTAPGTRRRCAPRCPTRSSAWPARASSPGRRPSRPGSCCVRSRSSATSSMFEKTDGGRRQYQRRHLRARQAHDRVVGRPLQLHAEPDEGQPVRAEQHLPDPHARRRRTTTTSMPSTASATSTRRTASSWRRS